MNTVFRHADKACVSDAEYIHYWENIREVLVRLGGTGYSDAMDKIMNQKMDSVTEEHYKELLKHLMKKEDSIKDKMNDLQSVLETSGDEGEFKL